MKKKKFGPETKEFKPANPEKYKGKWPIQCRSSLEKKAMFTVDNNPAIKRWTSESLVIPYYDPGKKQRRRYFTDLTFTILDKTGKSITYVVEIKPESQCHRPNRGKKQQKTFINECFTFTTNKAKWDAAKSFCEKKGWRFVLWTEMGLRHYRPEDL
jgi:hypothetical protein